MNIWITEKSLMKLHHQKRENFIVTLIRKILHIQITVTQREFVIIYNYFNDEFTKSYNEESNEGYFLEFDIQYPKNT